MTPESDSEFADLPQPPLHVIYTGRVQGVGFRWTCRSIAKRYDVTGTVRNLSDGTVKLVVAGSSCEVRKFLAAIQQSMSENISGINISSVPEPVHFADFRVIH